MRSWVVALTAGSVLDTEDKVMEEEQDSGFLRYH